MPDHCDMQCNMETHFSETHFSITVVREAVANDKPAIGLVYEAATSNTQWDDKLCDKLIDRKRVFIAEKDKIVIGFAAQDQNSAEVLKWLYVAPDEQRQGAGSSLLFCVESRIWGADLECVRTHAATDAVRFYLKHGYRRVSEATLKHDHDGVELIKDRDRANPKVFMVIERFKNRDHEAVYARFREKGRMLPDGLRYVDSWVEPNFDRCFQLMECYHPELFDEWTAKWNDLIDFEIIPVVPSASLNAGSS